MCKGISRSIELLSLVVLCGFGAACSKFARPTISTTEQEIIEAVIADNEDAAPSTRRGLFQHTSVRMAFIGDMTYSTLAGELRKNAEGRDQAFHDALEDFLRGNAPEETQLIFPRKLPNTIVLVSDREARKIFRHSRTMKDVAAATRHSLAGSMEFIRSQNRASLLIALLPSFASAITPGLERSAGDSTF